MTNAGLHEHSQKYPHSHSPSDLRNQSKNCGTRCFCVYFRPLQPTSCQRETVCRHSDDELWCLMCVCVRFISCLSNSSSSLSSPSSWSSLESQIISDLQCNTLPELTLQDVQTSQYNVVKAFGSATLTDVTNVRKNTGNSFSSRALFTAVVQPCSTYKNTSLRCQIEDERLQDAHTCMFISLCCLPMRISITFTSFGLLR